MRPLALDLFCGAGGAAMGLWRAGFDVIGVDNRPQRRYPFPFVQADALNPPFDLSRFDLIWASPPCQAFVSHTKAMRRQDRHPDLIAPVRAMLRASGALTCIENVPGAPLATTLVLTGDMFGLATYRRRHFETSFLILAPRFGRPFGPESRPGTFTVCGHTGGSRRRADRRCQVKKNGSRDDWSSAMGIGWMLGRELAQAIPPAYSEFIGRAALNYIRAEAA
jgi:DNA (cytosine-5)-methyltransferase 1